MAMDCYLNFERAACLASAHVVVRINQREAGVSDESSNFGWRNGNSPL